MKKTKVLKNIRKFLLNNDSKESESLIADIKELLVQFQPAIFYDVIKEVIAISNIFNVVFKKEDVCKLLVHVKSKIIKNYIDEIRNKLQNPDVEIEEIWCETPINERERIFKMVKDSPRNCIVLNHSIKEGIDVNQFNAVLFGHKS